MNFSDNALFRAMFTALAIGSFQSIADSYDSYDHSGYDGSGAGLYCWLVVLAMATVYSLKQIELYTALNSYIEVY